MDTWLQTAVALMWTHAWFNTVVAVVNYFVVFRQGVLRIM